MIGPALTVAARAVPARAAADPLTEAATEPAVFWTVVVSGCLSVVLVAASKVLPDAIAAWGKMREQRRRDRQAEEDARIVDLSSQVDHLAGRVWTLEQNRERMHQVLIEHAAWDQALIHAAITAGVKVQPPPPLYPPATAD